jgi:toxin ParE1/3/4
MSIKTLWTNQARADLLDIYELIGIEQPAAAERYFDRIENLIGLLNEQPRLGLSRPDISPKLRMLIERPYLILYQLKPDVLDSPVETIEIVRIVDGRRDLQKLF